MASQGERQVLAAWFTDQPEALHRVVSQLRRLQVRWVSLTVGETEEAGRRRLTVVIEGGASEAERLRRGLTKLVPVSRVERLGARPLESRQLALVKVAAADRERGELAELCRSFRVRTVEAGGEELVLEVIGDEGKLTRFQAAVRKIGILDWVRAEPAWLGRTPAAPRLAMEV